MFHAILNTRSVPIRIGPAGVLMMAALLGLSLAACAGQPTAVPSVDDLPTAIPPTAVPTPALPNTETPAPEAPSGEETAPVPQEQTLPAESAGPTENGQPLAARVNGQPVYADAFQKQVAQTEQALADQGILLEGADGDAQRAQVRENIFKGLIEQALIEQAAIAMQITVTEDELDASLQASTSQGDQEMDVWLAENNMSMDELRQMQRSQLITARVIQVLSETVPTTAEQVHARHIFTVDRATADAALARLSAGENFAAVAQQVSEDFSTAPNGGDLGWFPRETPMMPPAVMDVAFNLEPGQTSGVIDSEVGFHIVRVESREPSRPLTQDMLIYIRQRSFQNWLDQQMANANVERYATQ